MYWAVDFAIVMKDGTVYVTSPKGSGKDGASFKTLKVKAHNISEALICAKGVMRVEKTLHPEIQSGVICRIAVHEW